MNILVVTQYFYPEDFRINDICEELVRRGHKVTVTTGLPNYPTGYIFAGFEHSYREPDYHNGVKIIRCKNKPRKSGTLNLLINYISYYKKASKIINKIGDRFDVIFGYQLSPILSMLPAIKYKKKHKKPFYMYVCDIWPESIRDRGTNKPMSKLSPFYLIAKIISKKIYKQADIIGTKCEEFIDYLVDVCGVERKKCHVNFEHAENNYLNVLEAPLDNGVTDFLFAGNIGKSSNCDSIVRAASMLEGNYIIHFVGDGSELDNLKSLVCNLHLENKIVFYGRHPQSEMTNFYNMADVCLLTLTNNSAVGLTPPAKLSGYMASGRPIIAAIDGAAKTIIINAKCGLVSSSNDVNMLAKNMQKAIDNYDAIKELGKNGRAYFKDNFTLNKHVDNLECFLKEYENLYN